MIEDRHPPEIPGNPQSFFNERHQLMRLQLIKAAFWGITVLLAVAIAGLIGYYQGFARAIGITDLERTFPLLIADGVQMIRDLPGHIFSAGLTGTSEWVVAIASLILASGFLTSAFLAPKPTPLPISAAASSSANNSPTHPHRPDAPPDLSASTRHSPKTKIFIAEPSVDLNGPQYSGLARAMAGLGGTIALIVAAVHISWTVYRHHYLGAISILDTQTDINTWIDAARIAAGIDTIALIACVLWLLFAMRIPEIFSWLHVLGLVALGTTVAIAFAACAISVGTVSQINTKRPVLMLGYEATAESSINEDSIDDDSPTTAAPAQSQIFTPQLAMIVGRSASHLVLLRADGRTVLIPATQTMEILERQSIPEFVSHEQRGPASSDSTNSTDNDGG